MVAQFWEVAAAVRRSEALPNNEYLDSSGQVKIARRLR